MLVAQENWRKTLTAQEKLQVEDLLSLIDDLKKNEEHGSLTGPMLAVSFCSRKFQPCKMRENPAWKWLGQDDPSNENIEGDTNSVIANRVVHFFVDGADIEHPVITRFHDGNPPPAGRQTVFQSVGPNTPVYAIIPSPKKRSGDILDFRSLDRDIDAAIPSDDETEDPEVPQPNAGEYALTPSPPAGPPPRKKLKKDVRKPSPEHVAAGSGDAGSSRGVVVCDSRRATISVSPPSAPSRSPLRRATRQATREVITIEDNDSPEVAEKEDPLVKKTRVSSSSTAPRPRSFADRLNIVVSNLRPVADISSIERAPESNPSAAAKPKFPSYSETILEKIPEPEEGAVEDLGDGLGDDDSEDRPPTPPSEETNPARVEDAAPKTSLEEPEEGDATAATADDSAGPKMTAETEKNISSSDASLLTANSPTEERQDAEGENSQQLNKESSHDQELIQPMDVDRRVPEGKAVVASAEAGFVSPLNIPDSETQDARGSSSHVDNSLELQKLMSDLDEDIRKQKQSESINQTKFHYHHGGMLVSFQEMEKNLAAKETMLLNLRPLLDKQLAMEEQIAALQAESREKDALIQRLQSAAGSSGDHERLKSRIRTLEDQYAKASQLLTERDEQLKSYQTELEVAQKQIESHSAKEERFYQELSKAVDAETAATKLKEKEQLIAGLEDELSASTVEKSMLQRDHKKELGKVRDSLLELELSATEVIDYVYPSVELKDQKSSSELLEMMPAELKKHCRFIANMYSSAVLAKVKSHYPGLEEPRLLTGYACERPEALALIEEVKTTATEMVADLNVDP
ncbi:hypothetical protein EJB05_55202, partial [Eragrostis curvula]